MEQSSQKSILKLVPLYLCFILEVALLTFWRKIAGAYISPILLFTVSMSIAIYPLFIARKNIPLTKHDDSLGYSKISLLSVCFIIGVMISSIQLHYIFQNFEIAVKNSDIIPTLNILAHRFLEGKEVYAPITDFGYTLNTRYLPLHWLPFTISAFFNFDHRWTAATLLFIGILFYEWKLCKQKTSTLELILKGLWPFILLTLFAQFEPQVFGHTIESMVTGYYLLLGVSVLSRKTLLVIISFLLCLLSRFSLALWVPLFLLLFFFKGERKKVLYICLGTGIGILFIFVLPFLSQDWSMLTRMFGKATSEWHPQYWQSPDAKPFQLFRGIGFAAYFYDLVPGSIPYRMWVSQLFFLFFSILSVVIAGWYYFWQVRSQINQISTEIYGLLSLKLYLTVFYTFIHVPYIYLHLVPVFLSSIILLKIPFRSFSPR